MTALEDGPLARPYIDCVLAGHCRDPGVTATRALVQGEPLSLPRRSEDGLALHVVCKGCLKTVDVGAEGTAAIAALHLPGEAVHPSRGRRGRIQHIATGPTVVRSMRPDAASWPELPARALDEAGRRIERDAERIASLARHRPAGRLAAMLLDLGRRSGRRDGGRSGLTLGLGRDEVAEYLGLRPETVSRAFAQLEHQGCLTRRSWSRIVALDEEALRRLADA